MRPVRIIRDEHDCRTWALEQGLTMSREAWGDPPDQEPQRCPVCDGEWHAEGCELGAEVSRRIDAEREALTLRSRFGVASGWIVAALKVLDTIDPEDTHEAGELQKLVKAGEVLALTTLACSKRHNAAGNRLARQGQSELTGLLGPGSDAR